MKRRMIAGVTLLVLAALVAPAAAHEIPWAATEVAGLRASAGDGAVSVTGAVLFGGQRPVELAQDPAGDNRGGALTAPAGTDLVGVRISWPDPEERRLLLEMLVSQLPPLTAGVPEVVEYNWDIAVDGGAPAGGSSWSIKIARSRFAATQTTSAYAGLHRCTPNATTGGFTCEQSARLEQVEFERAADESRIRVFVPLDAIGASPGSTIDPWARTSNPVWVGASAAGQLTLTNFYDSIPWHERYVVPQGKRVLLGAAPAGEQVRYETPVGLAADDSFSGAVAVEGSGSYEVGALACFADNCGNATTTVTLTEQP